MTEKALIKLVLGYKKTRSTHYGKEVFDIVNYITDKKDGRKILSYCKDNRIDTIRVFKDIYFYSDLCSALEEWVKKVFHLEQFYFTGDTVWVQTTKKKSLRYVTNMVAVDISLKEQKLIVHSLNVFSESNTLVIESPFFVTDDALRMVEKETENALLFKKEMRGLMVYKDNSSLFFRNVSEVKTTDEREVIITLTDGTVEKIPY